MCGFAGYLQPDQPKPEILPMMVSCLSHRGPDAMGFHTEYGFGAGACRLAINGVVDGAQPLFDESGRVVLFYNGEIYNSPDLRRNLEAQGYRFRTGSDGEVICHLWHEHGADLFSRLDGMYALALWSSAARRLVLARDQAGEKPLHYARLQGGGIAFASEIRALLRHPAVDPAIDRQAAWDMPTFLWTPEPTTIHRNVRTVPPGSLLISDATRHTLRKIPRRALELPESRNPTHVTAEVRRRIVQAVENRLLSEVPIGSFLSGGLDSSIVATLAARRLPCLHTYCVGFESDTDPRYGVADEAPTAARLAERLGTRHRTIRLTPERTRPILERALRHADEPFAVSSGLGVMAVARAAHRSGVRVLLAGDGGDELFAGYPWHLMLSRLPTEPRGPRPEGEATSQPLGLSWTERIRRLEPYATAERAWALHYYASERDKAHLFHPDFAAGQRTSLRWFRRRRDEAWPPQRYLDHDRQFYLPNEMLRKLDRMTMAWSVESRAPFVAPGILDMAQVLQLDLLVGEGQGKWVLRRAFSDLLPAEVLARPKQGFGFPVDPWLQGPWADLVERGLGPDSALRRHGWIRRDALRRARSMLVDPERSHGHTVLSFIALNAWLERRELDPA